MTVETLIEHFNLVVEGYKFTTEDIWNVVVAASVQGQAIESEFTNDEASYGVSTCAPNW